MKAHFLVSIFLLSIVSYSAAQTRYGSIRVTVLDASNSQPVPYANVYLNRTTTGGYTDANGTVALPRIPYGSHELVISSIGYKPYQRKLDVKDSLPLYLTVKLVVRMLKAVEVKGKRDHKWHRQMARFERLFFGSHNKYCRIVNPFGLNFRNGRGEFSAEGREPLNIENDYLGYSLSFELRTFTFSRLNFVINGNVRFTEKKPADSATAARWHKNREEVYRGSPQHFFKSVVDKSFYQQGYRVYTDLTNSPDILRGSNFQSNLGITIVQQSMDSTVSQPNKDEPYVIEVPRRIEIHYLGESASTLVYRNVTNPVSWVEVKDGLLGVSAEGIVQNPQDLVVLGNMSNMKVADWLPLDYKPSNTNFEQPKPMIAGVLLEAPYLQVDRPYYYDKEQIWFKGYMNYSMPLLKDTLSHNVYVDLTDHDGRLISTKRYPLDSGRFNGDMILPDQLPKGNYQLKAYTQWMLNFDPGLIFTKTISLLGEKEAVRMPSNLKIDNDTTGRVSIRADKELYSTREKIVLTIDVADSLDFTTAANLSISVTDITQAVPPANEKNILTAFRRTNTTTKDTVAMKYNIQYGIDFDGTMVVKKKPTQGIITVFQDSLVNTFGMITDEAGRFGKALSFFDTVQFYIRARSVTGKLGTVVMDKQQHPPAPQLAFEELPLDIYAMDRPYTARFGNNTRLLEEVVVRSKRIKSYRPSPAVIHGTGDYTVTGAWMEENEVPDLPTALARKIPGVAVIYIGGVPVFTMRTGMGGGSLLILVDGVPMNEMGGDPYEILSAIPLRSVERVDVIKYSLGSIYGARGAGGVIAVFTKRGAGTEDPKAFDKRKLQAVKLAGYSVASKFEAPDYSKPNDTDYFDYRTTLYWNPNVTTDGNTSTTVSFFSADVATKYRVVVEGITADGAPVRGEAIISVDKAR